jgi:diguanylate cyclase
VQIIRRALAEPAAGTNVAASAEAVAELLNAEQASSQQEIDRLGGYLQQVANKVAHLQQQLLIVDETRTASLRESEAMGHTVTHRVQDIQTSVERSDDVQVLKASIRGGLQSLNKGVGDFVESARQRSEQTEVLLTTLTAQLQSLEDETYRLREKLTQECIRANTDPLTGLANRFAFDVRLGEESKRCDQQGSPLSLIIADIDRFKSINDAYGHQTGDKVLQTVALQLRSQLRDSDMLARFGGEEFIVLLPDTSLEQANEAAEKLRRHIAKCHFHHKAEEVPVTISLGAASLHPGDPPEALFERADKALYLAKTRGRNLCCSEHELPAEAQVAAR